MARPGRGTLNTFSSREMALAAALSPRSFSLLHEKGLAPTSTVHSVGGHAGYRLYDDVALGHIALVGALNSAGFPLLVSARLGSALTEEYCFNYGRLPSNLIAYLHAPLNPSPGNFPWTDQDSDDDVDIEQDFWLHDRLRNRSEVYVREKPIVGDLIVEIADREFVLTKCFGSNVQVSSLTSGSIPASPDYRIVWEGTDATVVPIHEEVGDLDFFSNPEAAKKMHYWEQRYLNARDNAVVKVQINLSLAIRNALDCLQDVRTGSV